MNVTILIFFLVSYQLQAACLPEVNTRKSLTFHEDAQKDIRSIEEAAFHFESVVGSSLSKSHDLTVRLEQHSPRINAEIIKDGRNIVVSVWGGMLRHPFMTADSIILLLCHEMGHLLGGPPLKARDGWSSTEGQADYFSTKICSKWFQMEEDRFYKAATELSQIYAQVTNEAEPRIDQCDERMVSRINYGYPTIQCRLDTLIAGWRNHPRPRCWYVE